MAMDKARVIEGVLRAAAGNDWSLSVGPEAAAWRLSRDGLVLFANVDRHWLHLCMPLAACPAGDGRVDLRRLPRLCHRMFMAKYSLDAAGQLLLQAEIPLAGADREYCRQAIEAMMVYSGLHNGTPPPPVPAMPATNCTPATDSSGTSPEREIVPEETLGLCIQSVAHLGWGLKERIGPNRWHAAYRGQERSFDVYLCANSSWVCLQVSMASGSPGEEGDAVGTEAQGLLARYLLRLNDAMYWAKVGVDECDQMALMIELPVGVFDIPRFRWLARTLATYADQYARDLQIAAGLEGDHHLSRLLLAANHQGTAQ